jgi:hypothetical protein
MRKDLQDAWDSAKKTDGTIYKNPSPEEIEPSLDPNERVLVVLKCLKKWGKLGGGEVSTAVLTDQTIHIFSRGIMKSVNRTHETVPFNTITGVELKRKLGSGWIIEFSRAANIDSLLKCDESGSSLFVENLKNSMRDLNQNQGKAAPSSQVINPIDQLKKLAELLDSGIISQSEFDEKKKSLIDRI